MSLGIENQKKKKKNPELKTDQLKKKKKSKGGQKLRLWVPPCMFIYENAIELWAMETELSFGQTTFLLWVPPFLSYEL